MHYALPGIDLATKMELKMIQINCRSVNVSWMGWSKQCVKKAAKLPCYRSLMLELICLVI